VPGEVLGEAPEPGGGDGRGSAFVVPPEGVLDGAGRLRRGVASPAAVHVAFGAGRGGLLELAVDPCVEHGSGPEMLDGVHADGTR
jgi:hypothetical protein